MFTALSPHAIGVQVRGVEDAILSAKKGGFEGVEFNVIDVAGLVDDRGAEYVMNLFSSGGLRPAGWSLPTDWRTSEQNWRRGLEDLPRLARAAASIGSTRTMTWILPGSDERPLEENWRFHVERFTPIAQILAEAGCRLGLEFVGPRTMRAANCYEFVYTMEDMLRLGAEIGPNVGLLLDCWHWYTSHGTLEQLQSLRAEQVVYVHVNDAPAGIATDEQVDNVRALPGETGVIDITGFLTALRGIGYDGPVVPEPFKRDLADLPSDDERLQVVGEAMKHVFARAGIPTQVPR